MKTFLLLVLHISFILTHLNATANESLDNTDVHVRMANEADQSVDSDADGFPDSTEALFSTDPMAATSYPGDIAKLAAESSSSQVDTEVTRATCPSGFRRVLRLCMQNVLNAPLQYDIASLVCNLFVGGRVATYDDLSHLYLVTNLDTLYDPFGVWIGNRVGDDRVLYGNRHIAISNDPAIANFEGVASKFDSRRYWCAFDVI